MHGPFTESIIEDYETEYHAYCDAMIGIDRHFGIFLDALSSNDVLNSTNVWEITLIVLTSDNGGNLDKGDCNYPLRCDKMHFMKVHKEY